MAPIRIAAALLTRADGRTLLVRKHGTSAFMQPGGKIAQGESPREALCRELREELGLTFHPKDAAYLGRFTAQAANEPGRIVDAEIFHLTTTATPTPEAEIEELVWVDPANPGPLPLAPLTRDRILPLCAETIRGLVPLPHAARTAS